MYLLTYGMGFYENIKSDACKNMYLLYDFSSNIEILPFMETMKAEPPPKKDS